MPLETWTALIHLTEQYSYLEGIKDSEIFKKSQRLICTT